MPNINTTLHLNKGTAMAYHPGDKPVEGVREVELVCYDRAKAAEYPFGLVRAELDGATWSACQRANAFEALSSILASAAAEVLSGHKPLVFVDINGGAIENARLVFSPTEQAQEAANAQTRSLEVPPLLPYQIGCQADGARALIYKANDGKGVRVHSIHATAAAATLAEMQFKDEYDATTAVIPLSTPISRVISAAMAGQTFASSNERDTPLIGSGLHSEARETEKPNRTALAAPSPFSGA